MGNWHISIKGTGPYQNDDKNDAEQLAADFVDQLKAAGHSIVCADVTTHGALNISDGKKSLAQAEEDADA